MLSISLTTLIYGRWHATLMYTLSNPEVKEKLFGSEKEPRNLILTLEVLIFTEKR